MFAEWIRPEHRSLPGKEAHRVKTQSEILELSRPAEVIREEDGPWDDRQSQFLTF